ncbi:MAG: ATP-binding protein [Planctomycetota bacterium]
MSSTPADFERLGKFFLGREKPKNPSGDETPNLLYDSKDLTTHAVVVGMTGSGKTGLCINLLEEAAIDKVPAIVIDPKGDISNLLLTFPDLEAKDFRPWVDPGQAQREGLDLDDFAAAEATKWKQGLAKWGQDGDRIRRLRENVELRIYTPGSSAGRPLTILKSFEAPSEELRGDSDLFRERISSTASGLLALLGLDVDPIKSREHILVSRVLEESWAAGKGLDLGRLINEIKKPSFKKVGVLDLDEFYPAKDRADLAMTLNNLLASPSFGSWLAGEALDVARLLQNSDGKPCISILSIAHLSESERMFFVTILLNEVLAWVRAQPGTSSLRAILYMDEVFGYFPPTKNPPSKLPMLTLLKQARAFGLGVVLATQNPVDLDYKGLSNTGTWFLGRLQTERDKARVIEGLEGAAAQNGQSFNRKEMEQILAGLSNRNFLLNNVHKDHPIVFETRWAMSYLRGPLTRNQIQDLVKQSGFVPESGSDQTRAAGGNLAADMAGTRESIPIEVKQQFVAPLRKPGPNDRLVYRPALLAQGRLHYVKASNPGVDLWQEVQLLKPVSEDDSEQSVWEDAETIADPLNLDSEAAPNSVFDSVPELLQSAKHFKAWEKELKDLFYRKLPLNLFGSKEFDTYSNPGEPRESFLKRLESLRPERTERIRKKYAAKFQQFKDQLDRAQQKVDREKGQLRGKWYDTILNFLSVIMALFSGRSIGRTTSSVRSIGRATQKKADVERAQQTLEDLQNKYKDFETEFNNECNVSLDSLTLDEISIPSRKTDIAVQNVAVVWLPAIVSKAGIAERAW